MGTALDVSQQTDAELAAVARREASGGPAFCELVQRHRERVWRICYRLLGNEHDAQDAAQEVLVRLFLQRTQFDGRSQYTTWLHAVAVRTCLALRRSRGRRLRREGPDGPAAWQAAQPRSDPTPGQSLDLDQMLQSLDEEDRAMLILKYAEGYSFEELGAIFELSVSACKMRLSRAKERLQREYGGSLNETTHETNDAHPTP